MECLVCRAPFRRGVRCPRCDPPKAAPQACGARVCDGCARRWALEGAEPRCVVCNAALTPEEIAQMFPARWRSTTLRDAAVARALELERARLPDVVDTNLYRLLVWLGSLHPRLSKIQDFFSTSSSISYYLMTAVPFNGLRSVIASYARLSESQLAEKAIDGLPEACREIRDAMRRTEINTIEKFIASYAFISKCYPVIRSIELEFNEMIGLEGGEGSPAPPARPRGFFCPADACAGYIPAEGAAAGRCSECGTRACMQCREPVGDPEGSVPPRADAAVHACNPAVLATVELIAKTSKPCPGCARPITRTEGCNQMFCTVCRTAFDWATGELLDVNDYFHNPHYDPPTANEDEVDAPADFFRSMRRAWALGNLANDVLKKYAATPTSVDPRLYLTAMAWFIYDFSEGTGELVDLNLRLTSGFYPDNVDLRALFSLGIISAATLGEVAEKRRRLLRLTAIENAALVGMRRRIAERFARVRARILKPVRGGSALARYAEGVDDVPDLAAAVAETRAEIAACQRALERAAHAAHFPTLVIDSSRMIRANRIIYFNELNRRVRERNFFNEPTAIEGRDNDLYHAKKMLDAFEQMRRSPPRTPTQRAFFRFLGGEGAPEIPEDSDDDTEYYLSD